MIIAMIISYIYWVKLVSCLVVLVFIFLYLVLYFMLVFAVYVCLFPLQKGRTAVANYKEVKQSTINRQSIDITLLVSHQKHCLKYEKETKWYTVSMATVEL